MNRIYFLLLILTGQISLVAIDPTFHLKNNSTGIIQINITQGGRSLFTLKPTHLRPIAKGGEFAFQVDTSKPTALELYYCPTAEFCKTNNPEKLIARFTENKTIYIKFEGKKIEPQKGNPITGNSTSGYSLKNNVTVQDISVIKAKPETVKLSQAELTQMIPQGSPQATKPKASEQRPSAITLATTKPTDVVPLSDAQPKKTAADTTQQVGKVKPSASLVELQMQEASTIPLETPEKVTPQPTTIKPKKQAAQIIELTGISKEAPESSATQSAQQTKPAIRIAPAAVQPSKKQPSQDVSQIAQKSGLQESTISEKTSQAEMQALKPDSKELAWNEFPEANLLRKKLKQADNSPFVARKVLGLTVGATEQEIKKSASKLESFYKSRSYRGDVTLVPDIITIITHAKEILIDAIYPTLSSSTTSPFRQELQKLFFDAPDGFEEFAAPVYQELISKTQYSRDFLQDIQKKVMGKKGLPEKWRQSVLSKIQRELGRVK